jgi:hypothetical protein
MVSISIVPALWTLKSFLKSVRIVCFLSLYPPTLDIEEAFDTFKSDQFSLPLYQLALGIEEALDMSYN